LEDAEKLLSEGVNLSEPKDLLFALVVKKADPSITQNRRALRMTLHEFSSSLLERRGWRICA
jgi:hypothetical protein